MHKTLKTFLPWFCSILYTVMSAYKSMSCSHWLLGASGLERTGVERRPHFLILLGAKTAACSPSFLQLVHSTARFEVQGTSKRPFPGLVNFVPAIAYHFCLNLPGAFSQPGHGLLEVPCIAEAMEAKEGSLLHSFLPAPICATSSPPSPHVSTTFHFRMGDPSVLSLHKTLEEMGEMHRPKAAALLGRGSAELC